MMPTPVPLTPIVVMTPLPTHVVDASTIWFDHVSRFIGHATTVIAAVTTLVTVRGVWHVRARSRAKKREALAAAEDTVTKSKPR